MSPVKVDGYIRGIRTLLQRCVCGRGGGEGVREGGEWMGYFQFAALEEEAFPRW